MAAALLVSSCNAAIGGGIVLVLGGVGYLAGACYDRVRVRVLDPETGQTTCSADVTVTDADGSERRLRPCYNAALTEGKWKLTARSAGYAAVSTELEIKQPEGACPHYTHTVELTLRREGEPPTESIARPSTPPKDPAPRPAAGAGDLESAPARVVPPPLPGIPTKAFAPVAPAPPAPAPAPPPSPAPAPAPAPPPPAPAPAPAPAPPPAAPR
jgi:hypothetical protein